MKFGDEIEFNVTTEDIQNGKPCDQSNCALASCIKRIPGVREVIVAYDAASFLFDYGVTVDVKLHPETTAWIHRYDREWSARDLIGRLPPVILKGTIIGVVQE